MFQKTHGFKTPMGFFNSIQIVPEFTIKIQEE
jgi:hypothetical protein